MSTDQARAAWALVIVSSVVKVFDETMKSVSGGIQIGDGFGEVGAVDVRDEPEGQGTIAVVPQRLVGHDRPEIRPADADVDDVADSLAGVAGPGAASNPVAEIAHAIQHAMDVRDHIVPVDDDRRRGRRAQRHVQDRAIFGDVDLVAAEHRVDPPTQIRFIRELAQQPHRLVGDAMLGVVEIDAGGFDRQPLSAARIVLEQLTEVPGLQRPGVRVERLPCGEPGE